MSAISSIVGSSASTSIVDSLMGTSSSTSSTGSLTQYALIKSGAYKKLMTAYYAEESSSGSKTKSTKETQTALKSAQSAAKSLASSAGALQKADYSEDNRSKLLTSLKTFVSDYNSVIESTDDIDDTAALRNVLWLTQQTSANEGLLKQIGINITKGNTLTLDEDTFNNAKLSDIKSLFAGKGSYGSQVVTKAAATYSAVSSSLKSTNNSAAYTSTGKYTSLASGSIWDSLT